MLPNQNRLSAKARARRQRGIVAVAAGWEGVVRNGWTVPTNSRPAAGDIAQRQRLMHAILSVGQPQQLNCVDEDAALCSRADDVTTV